MPWVHVERIRRARVAVNRAHRSAAPGAEYGAVKSRAIFSTPTGPPQHSSGSGTGRRKVGKCDRPYNSVLHRRSRSKKNLTFEQRRLALRGHAAKTTVRALKPKPKVGSSRPTAMAAPAAKHCVHPQYFHRHVQLEAGRGTLKRETYTACGAGSQAFGRPGNDGLLEAMEDFAVKNKFVFDYREMHEAMVKGQFDVSRGALQQIVKAHWRGQSTACKPLLTDKHFESRLKHAKGHLYSARGGRDCDRRNLRGRRHRFQVHIDEKTWYTERPRSRKMKIPPSAPKGRIYTPVQSKTQAPNFMVLTAVAGPAPAKSFTGGVCMFRVAGGHTAKNNSKNHAKGDVYPKGVKFNGAGFYKMLVDKVVPAISNAPVGIVPYIAEGGDEVDLWMGQAKPHTGGGNVAALNEGGGHAHPPYKGEAAAAPIPGHKLQRCNRVRVDGAPS